jgi:hypothetical protein
VHLLVGEDTKVPEWAFEVAEVVRYPSDRLTYQQFFDYANKNLPKHSIAAIANADIACDRTIYELEKFVTEKICVCLGRYDKTPSGAWKLTKKNDTQDLWAFRVPIKKLVETPNFYLGVPGCDNHIAYILSKSYGLKNPSKKIIAKHLHTSGIRNRRPGERVKGKIRRINPE